MFKKSLATALLVCTVPAVASASWFLSTQVKSAGGTIDSRNMAGQAVTDGAIFKSYTSAKSAFTVVVKPTTGYKIASVTKNGTTLTPGVTNAPYTINFAAGAVDKSASAVFVADSIAVGARMDGAGGIVNPGSVGNVYTDYKLTAPLVFTFTPKVGGVITGIDNVPTGGTVSPILGIVNSKVTVTFAKGYTFTAPVNMVAHVTDNTPSVTTAAQTAAFGSTVTLSATTAHLPADAVSTWQYVSGPLNEVRNFKDAAGKVTTTVTPGPGTLSGTNLDQFVVPAVAGQYKFQLTITSPLDPTFQLVSLQTINAVATASDGIRNQCTTCHIANKIGGSTQFATAIYNTWSGSKHDLAGATCYSCHSGAETAGHPGVLQCSSCHTTTTAQTQVQCAVCHTSADHSFPKTGLAQESGDCIGCHAVAIQHPGTTVVNDNTGVRAIMPEFAKRSHHITSVSPSNEQCAVCHLEGTVDAKGKVVINPAKHMADNKIHLRGADDDFDFEWSGTEHGNMDNFCFSCHDANGATSATVAAIMRGKEFGGPFSAKNPFADTLTNGYDVVARAGVVDVEGQFEPGNASHHAVKAPRYQFRFSTRASADIWTAAKAGRPTIADAEIAEFHVGEASPNGGVIEAFDDAEAMTAASLTATGEAEATLYEMGKFVATYTPLGASQSVGDNSQLHCGDCHTVGQWAAGSSTNANGTATTAAIGAHGSNNEYLLRNSQGTDALHNGMTVVCFNCHVATFKQTAGADIGKFTANPNYAISNYNQIAGYATSHAVSAMHGQCLADSAQAIGADGRLQHSNANAVVVSKGVWATADGATANNEASGNITGISCTNCHNSGLRSGFGGIHGGNLQYTDGLGRTQTTYRFMPGMGNYRYAPPGGWDGKDTSDISLLTQKTLDPVGFQGTTGKPMGGCYTNSDLSGADANPGFSSCSHHGTSTALSYSNTGVNSVNGPYPNNSTYDLPNGKSAQKNTYGGGTTASPTAQEPTIREATAGNNLVTRPVKY